MTKLRVVLVCAALLAPATAFAQAEDGAPGTVDHFTAADQVRAFSAASSAGYTPTKVEMFQDGNFFLTAAKNGQSMEVTVLPSGQVIPSVPVLPST